jgi:hypothetical protein
MNGPKGILHLALLPIYPDSTYFFPGMASYSTSIIFSLTC